MRVAGLGLLLACAISAVSCGRGGAGGTSSCLYTFASGPGDQPPADATSCREWKGASDQVAARQQDCDSAAGPADGGITVHSMFSEGPCPVANIVGGCRDTVGGITYTDWYYGPNLPAVEVAAACAEEGASFVPAP
jgi:hypothetical protein